jgi:hypothetical protein
VHFYLKVSLFIRNTADHSVNATTLAAFKAMVKYAQAKENASVASVTVIKVG